MHNALPQWEFIDMPVRDSFVRYVSMRTQIFC
jgi:hypothetical protein